MTRLPNGQKHRMKQLLEKAGELLGLGLRSERTRTALGSSDNPFEESRMASFEGGEQVKILKKGAAMRVIFFYPGEEGTYVDNAEVTLFENGIVHIRSNQEETTTHLQNCEILWRFEVEAEDRANKVRLLKPRSSDETGEKPGKGGPSKSPEPTV